MASIWTGIEIDAPPKRTELEIGTPLRNPRACRPACDRRPLRAARTGRDACTKETLRAERPVSVMHFHGAIDDDMMAVRKAWTSCADRFEVVLIRIEGGAHTRPGRLDRRAPAAHLVTPAAAASRTWVRRHQRIAVESYTEENDSYVAKTVRHSRVLWCRESQSSSDSCPPSTEIQPTLPI